MEIDEIIEEFEWFDGTFKREAVEAAVARRDEVMSPRLSNGFSTWGGHCLCQ